MKKKIAINGFGRIGRLVFRQLFLDKDIEVVAINDLTSPEELAYLLTYDSSQGRYMKGEISAKGDYLIVKDTKIKILKERNPEKLPWARLNVDIVVESTGFFLKKELAQLHIKAGAKKVILSAPTSSEGVKTIVYGVNHKDLNSDDEIISGASCTTNCLALPVYYLNEKFTIKQGLMSTIHSATNDQRVLDLPHPKDFRRGRSALVNIIPATTGAAIALGKVIPSLDKKLNGMAFRVPTVTGSVVDLVFSLENKSVTVKDINDLFIEKSKGSNHFAVSTDRIVSTDVIGETYGSIVDLPLTMQIGNGEEKLFKIVSWYDNENSYVSQFVKTLRYFVNL